VEKHLIDDLRSVLIFKWSTIGIGLVSFILECLGPEFDKDSSNISVTESGDHKGIHVEHPSLTANIFSIWVCSYFCLQIFELTI
jgi:hypothetical protein